MKKLFRKDKAEDRKNADLFNTIRSLGKAQLHKLANELSRRAQRLPQRQLTFLLVSAFFIVAFAIICKLWCVTRSKSQIKLYSIQAPAVRSPYLTPADDKVFRRIKKYHHYLDSMRANNRPFYDSVLMTRPHLMDSLVTIENITNP